MNAPKGKAVTLLIQAVKDPLSVNLDRVQVIKGWVDNEGKSHEKVYDALVAKADRTGTGVDLATGRSTAKGGAVELSTLWTDPDFSADQNAFYYVRVIELPTARHTLLDTIALEEAPTFSPKTSIIQERAYSSPIWYSKK